MTVGVRAPLRTCVGCRQSRPQAALLRIARTPDGSVEPDPDRRRGGRGAYLCPNENCLSEAVRRARWTHAFRAPSALPPETVAKVRAWIGGHLPAGTPLAPRDPGLDPAVSTGGRPGTHVEGGW